MRAALHGLGALWLLVSVCAAGDNRAWWAQVRLNGPLEEVRFDCGPDGAATLAAALATGEERLLLIPLPIRAPLGVSELSAIGPPRIELTGAGSATWIGWGDSQPNDAFESLSPGLRTRARAPARAAEVHVGAAELAFLGALFLVGYSQRRRVVPVLVLGSAAAAGLGWLAASQGSEPETTRVREVDLGTREAFELIASRGEVELAGWSEFGLPTHRVEVEPGHRSLSFLLKLDGGRLRWTARASAGAGAASLYAIQVQSAAEWNPVSNEVFALAESWLRTADGRWSALGAWALGAPLPVPTERVEPDQPQTPPPGWLVAGLPPGRGVLVGRRAGPSDAWLRVLGF